MRLHAVIIALFLASQSNAQAQDSSSIAAKVRAAGLLGEWSFNCQGSGRRIISASGTGASFVDHPSNDQYEIIALQSVDQTTIKMTYRGGTTDQRGQEARGILNSTYRICSPSRNC